MSRINTFVLDLARVRWKREGEGALLLAAAVAFIGISLAGARLTQQAPAPEIGYLAAADVSLGAWVPAAPPAPKPEKPAAIRPARAPAPVFHFVSSPLTREEGLKAVLATARSLVGRPYRYGAAGPDAFDCSGFTSFVWRAAGLNLPHTSAGQYGSVPRVPINSLQPGDLVFSGGSRVHHVGLYIGAGQMIDAVRTGRSVEIEPLRGNLIGAGRPALLLRPASKTT
jgi:cell wall-associated NlpC family hydrolase